MDLVQPSLPVAKKSKATGLMESRKDMEDTIMMIIITKQAFGRMAKGLLGCLKMAKKWKKVQRLLKLRYQVNNK